MTRGGSSTNAGPSQWAPATSPQPPPEGACELVAVENALLTPFDRGQLNVTRGHRNWMRGAVHDAEGELVQASQRLWDGDPFVPIAADPPHVKPRKGHRIEGTWLYAGHWSSHFGHFLLEVLTNLWPDPATTPVDGLVLHRNYRADKPPGRHLKPRKRTPLPWQAELLGLAGYGDGEIRVVQYGRTRVDHLLVPRRPLLLKSWARPEAVTVWRRIAAAVPPADEDKVFFSRKLHHRKHQGERRVRATERWDDSLEKVFRAAGFRILYPETLPVPEQVAIVRGARVLAGSSGSALHLAAFASPGTRVLEIGDARMHDRPLPTQRMIDAACGHLSAYVPHGDLAAIEQTLAELPTDPADLTSPHPEAR